MSEENEYEWTPWALQETSDEATGERGAPVERRFGTRTDANGRASVRVEERRPAGNGYTVVSQDAA